jgi:DNA-directed RNA polymerase subunit RPC12/RpoP
MMETFNFEIRYKGISRDLRTNEWEFKCKKCKKYFSPVSTVFATQQVECPKCGIMETINYNELN